MPDASVDHICRRAQGLANAGRWVDAERELRGALQQFQDHPSVLCNLGIVLAHGGQREAAIGLLQRAAQIAPDNSTVQENLARLQKASAPLITDRQMEVQASNLAYNTALKRVIVENTINCVIDVGANVGDFATHVRKLGYTGRIVSIEPASKPYAELVSRASADANWKTMQLAVGRSEGTAQLKLLGDSVLNTLGDPDPAQIRDFGRRGQIVGAETVRVRPLDALWDDLLVGISEPKILLKIDTQGHDQEVLAGAAQRLLPATLALQIELPITRLYLNSPTFSQGLEPLLASGWGVVGMYPTARYADNHTAIEFDCVLTRATQSS